MSVELPNIKKYDELTESEKKVAISINKEFVLANYDIRDLHPNIPEIDLNEFIDNFFRSGFYTFDENLLLR
jgi:hypothetical protein